MNGCSTRSSCRHSRWKWLRAASGLAASLTCLAILNAADGDLDLTFGLDGKVITEITSHEGPQVARDVAIDANGRIVAAGFHWTWFEGYNLALVRYNADGSLDPSFGTNGIVRGGPVANGAAIDGYGRIVVVGHWDNTPTAVVARYAENGSLDTSFGTGGNAAAACGGYSDVLVDTAGRIVVAGSLAGTNPSVFCVARFNEDGNLDTTFGTSGVATAAIGSWSSAKALAIDGTGKIAVVGAAYDNDASQHIALARFNDDGSLDEIFGGSGTILGPIAAATAIAIDHEDRVVVGGGVSTDLNPGAFFAARYTENGTPDSDFNGSGRVVVDFSEGTSYGGSATAVAIDAGSRIVVVGPFSDSVGMDIGVARLNADGSLDTSFGAGGKVRTDFSATDYAEAVAIDAGHRIVVAGAADGGSGTSPRFALARYDAGSGGYTFSGFFAPVDNAPAFNVIKAGRAVPVKFSLNGNQGLDIFAPGFPTSQAIACDAGATLEVLDVTLTAATSSLSYDPATDQYTYVWKTEKAWANTCRQLILTLRDGSRHVANFQISR